MKTQKAKGIYWHNKLGKFMVNISIQGQRFHIGYFSDFESALKAKEEAWNRIHGIGIFEPSKKIRKFEKFLERLESKKLDISEEDKKLAEAKVIDIKEIIR